MRLGLIKRIDKGDLAKGGSDLPKWIDPFLDVLNYFIEKVALALQNRLTFEDNFLCKLVSQDFTHATEVEINPSINVQNNLRVTGVMPLSAGGLVVDRFGWSQKANGNIGVTFNFSSGTTANCKILILLG